MKIDLSVTDIDYVSVTKKFLPGILEKYAGEENGLASEIIGIIGDDRDAIISAVSVAVSDEKKEKIISALIKEYQSSVCEKLTEILKAQNIALVVKGLNAEAE